ncbi:MAG: hypothetical protein L0241_27610, partial [Planctomycetia bacterium]|nr:hypothetical protein [Planctomycetia bacterium]
GLRVDGPLVEIDVSNNRFFNLNSAVSLTRPAGRVMKGTFTNNTVYQCQFGIQFELPPKDQSKYDLTVKLNYFARTPELLKTPGPVAGLISADNLHDPNCGLGNPPLVATRIDTPLQSSNPADPDEKFLRFAPNTAPTAGPKKERVGAQ